MLTGIFTPSAGTTFLRVNVSLLLAAAWTIPGGVAIGFNPRLARIAQPLAQISASVPATALFPILLPGLIRFGGGMGIASILLMLLGAQWYILFNLIAGAIAILSDLREVSRLFHFTALQRWRTHPAWHFPLSHHRDGDRFRWSLEREYRCGILPSQRSNHADSRAWRSDQLGNGPRSVPVVAALP
ncbi:MAG: ABC transporter permease subunit [Janthinobacterium lividum]